MQPLTECDVWRIGVLSGTGTARKRTIPALLDSHVCRVTVVHGRSQDGLRRAADMDPGIRLAASEQEFAELREHYDVVFIGSPPFLHPAHIELAVQLGMPAICEKPLVARREPLEPVLAEIAGSGLPFMLAHHVRHQAAVADIAEIIASRRFGEPVAASLQWCFMMNHDAPSARWKLDPRLGGSNAMFDCGVHAIDIAVRLFGVPTDVTATGQHRRSVDTHDAVAAVLQYPKFAVTVTASQSGSPAGNDLKITFPDCVLRANAIFSEKAVRSVEIVGSFGSEELTYETANLYRAEVEDFCRSLEGSVNPGATVADAAACSRILFAMEDSIRTGRLTQVYVDKF